jgi:hypothetical protein
MSEDMQAILQRFPPVDFAFAYGSGIFPQDGYNEEVKIYIVERSP